MSGASSMDDLVRSSNSAVTDSSSTADSPAPVSSSPPFNQTTMSESQSLHLDGEAEIAIAYESKPVDTSAARDDDDASNSHVDPSSFLFNSHRSNSESSTDSMTAMLTGSPSLAASSSSSSSSSSQTNAPSSSSLPIASVSSSSSHTSAPLSAPQDELFRLPASHPLVADANAQLLVSLKEKMFEVKTLLDEKKHQHEKLKEKRLALGENLYNAQQLLGKQQEDLVKQQRKIEQQAQARVSQEAQLSEAIDEHRKLLEDAENARAKQQNQQSKLDEMRALKKQIERYDSGVKNEILVARSVAEYTETLISSAEKAKNSQDEDLAEVGEKIATYEGERRIVNVQIEAQEGENNKARAIVEELQKELDLISEEQRQFTTRKNQVVLSSQSKQDALILAQQQIEKLTDEWRSLTLEQAATKLAIKKQQDEHGILSNFLARSEAEHMRISQQIETISQLNGKYMMQFDTIHSSLVAAEAERNRQNVVNHGLDLEISSFTTQIDKLINKRQAIEVDKTKKLDAEKTIEKGSEQLYRAVRQAKSEADQLHNQLAQFANDMARVENDRINTNKQCETLQTTLARYEAEADEKKTQIGKYQQEEIERLKVIDKKQNQVKTINDDLKRIIEANAKARLEPTKSGGHLEIQIGKLKTNLKELKSQNEEQQKAWIKGQSQVVVTLAENAAIASEFEVLQAKKFVLEQQSKRLTSQIENNKRSRSQLDSSIAAMGKGGQKMNGWIAQLETQCREADDENRVKKQEFVAELKEEESKAQAMQSTIVDAQKTNETLKNELLANESAVLLWQKKIEIERETQALLDPTVGLEEINALKKDIKHLEGSIGETKRMLEASKQEMSACVTSAINARCLIKPVTTKQRMNAERVNMEQQIGSANRAAKNKHEQLAAVREAVAHHESNLSLVREELHRKQLLFNHADLQVSELERGLKLKSLELRIVHEQKKMSQKKWEKLEDCTKTAQRMSETQAVRSQNVTQDLDVLKLKQSLMLEKERSQRLESAMRCFAAEQPRHADWTQRLLAFV